MRLVHNSLHDEVASRLRERIFAGELVPGGFLDEPTLCAEMGISRTPFREALKVLTAEGRLRATIDAFIGAGARTTVIATQIDNRTVQRAWVTEGFSLARSEYTIHINFDG